MLKHKLFIVINVLMKTEVNDSAFIFSIFMHIYKLLYQSLFNFMKFDNY